jgi:hypothetical protein
MTYQEQFEILFGDLNEKALLVQDLEVKVAKMNGSGHTKQMSFYHKAKREWQISSENYSKFISFFTSTKCRPNDEFGDFRLQA